ncbi:MAG: MMPL family transporter [bacterium]
MSNGKHWSYPLAKVTTGRPGLILLVIFVITVIAGWLSSGLTVNMQMANMLPSSSTIARNYLDISNRFAENNTLIAIEGRRDSIVAFAEAIEPRLHEMEDLYNVQARFPVDYTFAHGLMLQKPKDLDRSLQSLDDPSLIGVLRGINDDYEREYSDDEGNLKRDEIQIAHSMLGTHRSLEVLLANLEGQPDAPPIEEAVDAWLVGDPWNLSLDRRMLLITIAPQSGLMEQEGLIATADHLEALLAEFRPKFPGVEANLTGNGPLQRDETNSMNQNTILLSLVALLLVYLLLARNWHGWLIPILALLPLIVGIVWTMAGVRLLFGTLNMFTAMIMLILIGLGIDFSIHLVSRYYEERAAGSSIPDSAERMLGNTGKGVLTGGLTTAAAFLSLMVADSRGIFELGVSAALGVVLTLVAVFISLPALLALRDVVFAGAHARKHHLGKRIYSHGSRVGLPSIGNIAAWSYRHRITTLTLFLILVALAIWGAFRNEILFDWLEMEPDGLKNIQLQREIPNRFGVTDQGAWSVAADLEQGRKMAEEYKDLPAVGDVSTLSDLLPAPQWIDNNRAQLSVFRSRMMQRSVNERIGGDWSDELGGEIDRLWDNLDLMSNLAFQSGIDRVVRTIDDITGYNSESDTTDESALMPRLSELLTSGVDPAVANSVARRWRTAMRARLIGMSNPVPPTLADVPDAYRKAFLPRTGNGILVLVNARRYLFNREAMETFHNQIETIDPNAVSSPRLTIAMMDETIRDGSEGGIVALIAIALLLLLHFRGPLGLLAILPLMGGSAMMLGALYLVGIKYNFMNLIAVPIILGIGIDDGVHALHRWRETSGFGAERIRESYKFVGRAILMTSLTTMIGFGSLGFYALKAISTFGIFLFFGVGFCFITSITALPAMIGLVQERRSQVILKDVETAAS